MITRKATREAQSVLQATIELVASWNSVPVQGRIARAVGVEIPEGDVRALYMIGMSDEYLQPSALADMLQMTRPTMSKVLTRLHAAGLIERHRVEADRRALAVGLTEQGQHSFGLLVQAGVNMVKSSLEGLTSAEVAQVTGVMTELSKALHRD
ncbi:MarR family transcriptional regulator [Leucobacter sp. UCMA 4100]|uniref:MarR family winged helix-turn-helix transcriptional regulator n=1 Tax=Leucobacter sp. UCMA 4100 TaxID=2810534 RepID=UPI0022EB23A7|nr:MarR family transcriptional regulator [Leucobacter sp. UCMA 4100]MDA3147823.1 MarR family transcriptional regulator [Leucobacter sp. UCMA 4100]